MTASDDDMLATLEKRLGRLHARQRLGIEKDHEAQIFGQGLNFFHLENATLSLDGERQFQSSRDDWLHVGRRRRLHRAGPLQLPAGGHAASLA